MRTLFTWVHLADLNDLDARLENWNQSSIPPEVSLQMDVHRLAQESARPDAMFVTGDLRLGNDVRYDMSLSFLTTIIDGFLLERKDVFVVPGNHDVDLKTRDRALDRLLRSLRDGQESLDDILRVDSDRILLERRFQAYLDFTAYWGTGAKLFWSEARTFLGNPFRFIGLNTEFLFNGKEDGKLLVGETQLAPLKTTADEIVIVASHHSLASDRVRDGNVARSAIDARAHVHLVSASYLNDAIPFPTSTEGTLVLGAGGRPSRQNPRPWSYYLASLLESDQGRLVVRIWPRQWSAKNRDFRLNVDALPEGKRFVDIPLAKPRAAASAEKSSRYPAPHGNTTRKWSEGEQIPYIEKVALEEIGALHQLLWQLQPEPGWNVLIGDNGSGKTTFLRTLSYALTSTSMEPHDDELKEVAQLPFSLDRVSRLESLFVLFQASKESTPEHNRTFELFIDGNRVKTSTKSRPDTRKLFSAGFGPFRRFTGGDEEFEKEMRQFPNAFRHISLFTERIAFHESIEWLKTLDHRALRDTSALPTLDAVKKFVNNDDLLPNGVRLVEINADAILFEDGNKRRVELADLSDGYRSILSLSLELVRQLVTHYDLEEIFDPQTHVVVAPGIVLIDEVDAHLHPSWQRVIGPCLRKLFRGFQFIVTTHSPLVCQGAADGCGSVFRLPKPGTNEEAQKLEGVELYRILYGNVLDAYGTGAFGEVERSEEGQRLREELVALNLKEVSGGLTAEEEIRQDKLRAIFPGGK